MNSRTTEKKHLVESLYRRYWFQVERHCYRMLKNHDDAKDAAQEAFVALLNHADKYRFQAEWMTWLYRVSTNICLNRLKHDRIRHHGWRSSVRDHFYTNTKHNCGENNLWSSILSKTLAKSDESVQRVAFEYFVNDRTHCEISSRLDISRPTVKKRIVQFLSSARQLYSSLV